MAAPSRRGRYHHRDVAGDGCLARECTFTLTPTNPAREITDLGRNVRGCASKYVPSSFR